MKSPLAISTFLALAVLASSNQTDLKLILDEAFNFANTSLTFAHKLVSDFPHTPEAVEVNKSISLYTELLQKLSPQSSNQTSHLIETISTLALTNAQVHLFDHRLRQPTVAPLDAKNQILSYARDIHANGASLLAEFPHFPANNTVKSEMATVSQLIKGIETEATIVYLIPPISMLVQGDIKLADISRHYRHPNHNAPDDHTKVHTFAKSVLKYGSTLHGEILHTAEAKEVEKIVVSLKHQIHQIESHENLDDIIGTIAALVREHDKLVAIAKKLGKPTH